MKEVEEKKQPVKSDLQIVDERNQKLTLHNKLSKEDLDWFNKECTR